MANICLMTDCFTAKNAIRRSSAGRCSSERCARCPVYASVSRRKCAGRKRAQETDTIRWAKKYVAEWRKVKAENLGLLLWGDVGTGKSFAAACIANALLEQMVPVLMTNFSKILNQMGAMYTEERYQYIASLNHYSLLIIDDLGIERSTEYAKEQVYAVIDERYKANLPLIITTNLTINEIRNPENVADARIYSRVLEMCTPVHVGGADRRQAVSRDKQELVKSVLFSGKGGGNER